MLFGAGCPAAAAANGMAFTGGNVIPFANGGVVSSPTMFPMSRGRTGLMGEAGPEAVMPLRRAKDGKLGVGAEPQKVDVVARVYVDEGGNWQAKVERIADMRVSRAAPALVRQSVGATYAASTERRFK
jgi:phage-related minor tail protein